MNRSHNFLFVLQKVSKRTTKTGFWAFQKNSVLQPRSGGGCDANSSSILVIEIDLKSERGKDFEQSGKLSDINSFGFIGNH